MAVIGYALLLARGSLIEVGRTGLAIDGVLAIELNAPIPNSEE